MTHLFEAVPLIKRPWQLREHSAAVSSRYFSGGWEFETARDAREWMSAQHARENRQSLIVTSFTSLVCSNGVAAQFYHAEYYSGGNCMVVQTTTYRTEGTMRDKSRVSSPSDCVWLIPGTEG